MISVIIPVYNVEKYLHQCFESLIRQSFQDLEIIVVDDQSPDNCGQICDLWAQKDSRIHVIHQQHAGISAARNTGIDIASGEYIGFVDPDDWIHKDMYLYLYHAIEQFNADIVICHEKAVLEDQNHDDTEEKMMIEKEENHLAAIRHFTDDFTGPICWVWNKLYRREIIGKNRFPKGKTMEDIFFNSDIFSNVSRVVWIQNRLYYYRQRAFSFCAQRDDSYYLNYGEGLVHMDHTVCKGIPEEEQKKIHMYVIGKLALIETEAGIAKRKEANRAVRAMFLLMYNENISLLKGNRNVYKLYLARYARRIFHMLKYKKIIMQSGINRNAIKK